MLRASISPLLNGSTIGCRLATRGARTVGALDEGRFDASLAHAPPTIRRRRDDLSADAVVSLVVRGLRDPKADPSPDDQACLGVGGLDQP
ncbi:hypothetical protein UK12_33460, partial [Saccharothrix sp. ST-888]